MSYRIVNKSHRPLSAFHSNGGWSIGDVFPCSYSSWISFETENEAKEYIEKIKLECSRQAKRWGEWTKNALKFSNSLKVEIY